MSSLRLPAARFTDGTTLLRPDATLYNGALLFRLLFCILLASVHLGSIQGAAPTFVQSVWRGNVSEDAATGTSVLRIEATDADGDSLDYTIWGGKNHNHFSLGFSNGMLSTDTSLDREKIQSYTLTVSATDYISFPQATVVITVLDVNDNPPSCNHATIMIPLSESVRMGTRVTKINCTDADVGLNGQLEYRIASGDALGAFTIQNSSGIMETAKNLDYELTTTYKLTVTVSDMGQPTSLQTNVTVLIPVQSVNEYTPRFSNSSYAVNVVAESPLGVTVLRVSADDPDKGPDGLLTYTMAANTSNHFTIGASSGDIVLSKVVLYECLEPQNNVYPLTIAATDSGHPVKSTSVNVTVAVVQRNNHSPTCSPGVYAKSVPESVDPGTVILRVICSDLDGNSLTYEITDIVASNVFNVTKSGELVTRTALDYEKQTSYNLVIVAKESCVSDSKSATALVTVQVTGVNEHSPTFTASTYNVSVREDARIGSAVLHLNATDEDDGPDGDVYYNIRHPPRSTEFLVDRLSGMLILARSLDRETKNVHLLIIEATDHGLASNRKTASALVNVTVEDVNDNAPICSPSVVVATVEETVHVGATVASLSCHDLDADVNSQLSYQISGDQDTDAFTVTSWGEIRTDASLARPHLPDLFSFPVTVSDNGYPRQAVNSSVVVQLTRKQGQTKPPVFQSLRYDASLYENSTIGTTVVTVTANNPRNASVWYSIVTSDAETALAVDPVTGDIVLTGTLDREVKDSYTVIVGASAGDTQGQESKRIAIVTVSIDVSDVNDNTPSCTELVLTASISESASLFTSIAQLQCSDIDKNENGYLTFQIVEPNNDLPIILTTDGEFRTNATLDYESTQSYFLIATVQDSGTPPKQVNVSAMILVEPVNEFPPVFPYESLNVSIPEDTFVGTVIINLQANDSDRGKDGQVTYTITGEGGSVPFVVEKVSGRVLLTATLDREMVQFYSMTVTAKDCGTAVKSTSIPLLVTVADRNDNSPSCHPQTIVVSLSKDIDNGTAIAGLNCNDPDQSDNSRLSYNITSQSPIPFTIDSFGRIYVTGLALQHQPEVYTIPVKVTDSGTPKRSTTVQIIAAVPRIDNKGAVNPTFDRLVVSLTVPESATIGNVIVRLNCTVSAGIPKFNITEGDYTHQFDVGLLGDLMVVQPIDYETEQRYRLTIVCSASLDSSRFASSLVDIQVTDVNEFSPVFSQKTMTVTVSEGRAVGSLVTTVTARDRDVDGKIEYSIAHAMPTHHPFILDPVSGRMSLLRRLDRELVDRYDVNITASDSLHHGYTFLRIVVSDINDNPPSCQSLVHLIVLNGTERENTVVGKLNCTDKDTGSNGQLKYRPIGPWSHLFEINSRTGQLTLSHNMTDMRVSGDVVMKALVSDEGRPFPLNETIKVVVRLLPPNRYSPEFLTPRQRLFKVNESERLGSRLGQITARDRDETDTSSSAIEYRLSARDRTQPFFLDRRTGILYLIGILDRERVDSYLLTIEATDAGYPVSRTSTTSFAITVLDINDNPPVCTPPVYGSILNAGAPPDTALTKINCSDADLGKNAALQYEIREDTRSGYSFRVNSTGHVIVRNRSGLISELPLLQLPVIVRDRGSVSLSTTVIVVVRILGEIDRLDTLTTMRPGVGTTSKDDESEWMTNSVEVELLDFDRNRWTSGGRSAVKALFALGATVYCTANPSHCSVIKPMSDRNNELVLFDDSHVVLIQTKQITKSDSRKLLVSFYISLPENAERLPGGPTSTVIPQKTVQNIVDYAKSSLEASPFTLGNSWPATSLFSKLPVSDAPDDGRSFGEIFSDNKILAVTIAPSGAMLILCLLLAFLLYRHRRRRAGIVISLKDDRWASMTGRQVRNSDPVDSDSKKLSSTVPQKLCLPSQNDTHQATAASTNLNIELDECPIDLSTISLPKSYCRLSNSSFNTTLLPGALASTEDSDDEASPSVSPTTPRWNDCGTTDRNCPTPERRRSLILRRLNTKLKMGLVDLNGEDSGIESDLRTSRTPLSSHPFHDSAKDSRLDHSH